MKRRVYAGDYTRLQEWQQVIDLTQNGQADRGGRCRGADLVAAPGRRRRQGPLRRGVPRQAGPAPPRRRADPGGRGPHGPGASTAAPELPLGEGTRVVDVWLSAGTHDLTVFAATTDGRQTIGATWARATLSSDQVTLHPFQAPDFDLSLAEAKTAGNSGPGSGAEPHRTDLGLPLPAGRPAVRPLRGPRVPRRRGGDQPRRGLRREARRAVHPAARRRRRPGRQPGTGDRRRRYDHRDLHR